MAPPWPADITRDSAAALGAGGSGYRPFEPEELDSTDRRDDTLPRPERGTPASPQSVGPPDRAQPKNAQSTKVQSTKVQSRKAQPTKDRSRKDQEPRTLRFRVLGASRELAIIVIGALLITTLLRSFVFQPFQVPSESMENTLQIGDKIVAQRVWDFRRGDVVVFKDTNGWLTDRGKRPGPARRVLEFVGLLPDTSAEHMVKRVVGMPGDRVKCCDKLGRVTVNGFPLEESGYLYSDAGGRNKPAEIPFEVVVPAGRIFVMGDHRSDSGDSRCHLRDIPLTGGKAGSSAFVPISEVVGSVVLIAAPFSRFQRLETPPVYAGIPPPQQVPPAEPVVVQGAEGC